VDEPTNRYLLGLTRLFALVAGADGPVNASELGYVHDYLRGFYPERIAARVFADFRRWADAGSLDFDATLGELDGLFSHEEKVFLLLTVYELAEADDLRAGEIAMGRRIAARLGLTELDTAVLESLFRLGGASTPRFDRRAALLPLRLGDLETPATHADLRLPTPGLELEIYKVNHVYYVRQRDNRVPVRLGERPLRRKFATRLEPGRSLHIGGVLTFHYVDLIYYFNCLLGCYSDKTLYLRSVEQGNYQIHLSDAPDSRLAIELRGLTVRLRACGDADLAINYELHSAAENWIDVLLGDHVVLDSYDMDLRKIVANSFIDEQPLAPDAAARPLVISNGTDADVFISDGLPRIWRCTLQRQAGHHGGGGGALFEKATCPHAIYADGARVQSRAHLGHGGTLLIGNHRLQFDFAKARVRRSRFSVQSYRAEKIRHRFHDGRLALDNVSFEIGNGELVCILGPSGCGKSTLLSILNGQNAPSHGRVLVEGYDLHGRGKFIARQLGYVPQDDLLLENLTVAENLVYSARLRWPKRSPAEIHALVAGVLHEIGLEEQRHTRVGDPTHKVLSGGQRKRLNIGLELLGDAAAYLLDEPTSGLSSEDSLRIVDLLKHRALDGRIIFTVLHQPSAKIFRLFDKVILLDRGGRLAFCGDIDAALIYFQAASENADDDASDDARLAPPADDPDLLLKTLEAPLLNIDGTPLDQRRHPPEYWQEKFLEYEHANAPVKISLAREQSEPPPVRRLGFLDRLGQTNTLLAREFLSKLRNRSNLWTTGLVAPLLGLLVGLILRQSNDPDQPYALVHNDAILNFFFLSSVIAIFLALSNSLAEIIRDRPLLLRERMVNIPASAYLGAKYLTLCLLSALQIALFLAVSFLVLKIRDGFWADLGYLVLAGAAASALGLAISALPGLSEKAAANLLPLLLVPQIVLAGSQVFEFSNMKHLLLQNLWPHRLMTASAAAAAAAESEPTREVPEIADWFILSRWAYEGLVVLHETHSPAQEAMRLVDAANATRRLFKTLPPSELAAAQERVREREARAHALEGDPAVASQQNITLHKAVKPFHAARDDAASSPFLVAEKRLPAAWFGGRRVTTPLFNAGVLLGFTAFFLCAAYALILWGAAAVERIARVRGVFSWQRRTR